MAQRQTQQNVSPPGNRTLLQSWTAIPPRTRLLISIGVCVFGVSGLMVSDYLEKTALQVKAEKAEREKELAASSMSRGY